MGSGQDDAMYGRAVECHRAGRLEEAEGLYRRCREDHGDSPHVLNSLGILAHARGEHGRAIELLNIAVGLAPDVADYHFNLGVVLASARRLEEAAGEFEGALRLEPRHFQAAMNLGAA